MTIYRLLALFVLIIFMAYKPAANRKNNASKEEWVQLFNKKDLTNWDIKIAGYPLNDNYNNTFYVKDGDIIVDYSQYKRFNKEFGHLYYRQPFSYYKVRVEYRFYGKQALGGPDYAYLNSGVMLHSQSAASLSLNQTFPVSLEFQLLASDSLVHRPNGNLCTPGTEVNQHGKTNYQHCIDSKSRNCMADEWVSVEAVVLGDSVIYHLVNGDTVLSYEKPHVGGGFVNSFTTWTTSGFAADSLAWIQKAGTPLQSGYIALQAESHPVEFRKVELLNLEGCMDKNALNYKSYYIKADNSKCRYK